MAKERILLTGATGNVGAVTLEHLLETSHTINAIVRNAAKAVPFFTSKYPDAVSSGQLVITPIPDMTVSGVFDEAAAIATAIIHIATPLGDSSNFVESMVKPTWDIDHNILEAAKKSKTVKRVIVCGTILQTMKYLEAYDANLKVDETRYNDLRIEDVPQNEWGAAYQYSKTNAEKKTWEWVRENKEAIDFDVVMLLPPSITGRSPQMSYTPDPNQPGGMGGIIKVIFSKDGAKGVDQTFPFFLDTDDVAKCHVLALDKGKVKGNKRYLIVSNEILDLRKVVDKLKQDSPELAERLPTFEESSEPVKFATVDSKKGNAVFGTAWKSAYESAKATIEDALRWEKENGRL